MEFNPHWIYPRIRNARRIVPYVFLCGVIGGLYGAVHDQISYTVSPEYFTAFKFHQFSYLDFGLPDRIFAGIIGFFSTWWVGMIVGWFLARIRFNNDNLETARRDILKGVITVFTCALSGLVLGAIAGYIRAFHFQVTTFMRWEQELSDIALQRFVVVGYTHNAGYIGGLLGLILAIVVLKKTAAVSTDSSAT